MVTTILFFILLQGLMQFPQRVGYGLNEETRLRMKLRARHLNREMARLLQELEQCVPERSVRAWGAQLWAAMKHWNFWAFAGVLVLLLGLCFIHWWRSHNLENSGEQQEEDNDPANAEEGERDDVIVEEGGNVGANEEWNAEEGGHNDNGNEGGNVDAIEVVEVENDRIDDIDERILLDDGIQRTALSLERNCEKTTVVMDNLLFVFGRILANSFHPRLQRAIGVGSAFEGWSPREEDVVYRVLVPLAPPTGHSFHLELDTSGQVPGRNFHIRVELECTCATEEQDGNMLCFLHHPEEELRRNQEPSLLHTLCTGSYLDVQKTARWFYQLVRAAWVALPQSHNWHLVLLPSSRSCKFKLTKGTESLMFEIQFGVRQGYSDIFVSSQPTESLFTPSTMWPECYAVAEVKFFRHIASRAPQDSWHLICLQLLARALVGINFSTYTMKTIVMHLLNTVPVTGWRRRDFLRRLRDTMEYLRFSLNNSRLDHFVVGNQRIPPGIILPPDVYTAEPPNLFHHLVQDPAAYTRALSEYHLLESRLRRMLLHGH